MTFDEFWKQSGWHSPGEEIGGTSEYNLAKDAYEAGRATVSAALREALAAIAAIPISDYSTDGDAAELVRRDDAADIVRAAMAKLGVTECNNQ